MPSGRLTRALPLCGGALAPFLAVLVLAGCTTQSAAPEPDPNPPRNQANRTNQAGPTSDAGMTAVPEQAACFVEKDLSADPPLRPRELWPGAAEERAVAFRETRQDAAGCAPTARLPAACDGVTFPWVFSQNREIYAWTGARRVVAGIAAARLAVGSDPGRGSVVLEYVLLRFDRGDPARTATGEILADLVQRCGRGRAGSLGGVAGLVGEQTSIFGAGTRARGVLVSEGDDLLWLLVDGGAWSADSERRAVGLAARQLRAG